MNEYLKLLLILYSEWGYNASEVIDRLKANCPKEFKASDAAKVRQWYRDTLGYEG